MTQREQFVKAVSDALDEDSAAVLLLGDISVYAFRAAFQKHPQRVMNIGIMEQSMVGIAAGLAIAGFYPIIHTIDSFLVRRAYEQIYLDFGEQKLGGIFVTVGADSDYEKLGPSHRCPEGLTLMKCVVGMRTWEPKSDADVRLSIASCHASRALGYIRLSEKQNAG